MATLITLMTNDGIKGRCDERCYNATGPDCTCCCGEKNHGVGVKQARTNTRDMLPADVLEHLERKDSGYTYLNINSDVYQYGLFDD